MSASFFHIQQKTKTTAIDLSQQHYYLVLLRYCFASGKVRRCSIKAIESSPVAASLSARLFNRSFRGKRTAPILSRCQAIKYCCLSSWAATSRSMKQNFIDAAAVGLQPRRRRMRRRDKITLSCIPRWIWWNVRHGRRIGCISVSLIRSTINKSRPF